MSNQHKHPTISFRISDAEYDSYADFGTLFSAFLHSISTFSPW